MLIPFFQYRELLSELTKREIKSRYKQSILGYAWVILNPLCQMLVMAFVFSVVLNVPSQGVPYSIFLYVGLLPWTLFANSLVGSTNSLVNNSALITKIYFPRELFVLSTILSKIVDFVLATTVLIAFMLFYRLPISWHVLWVIPIFFIQQLLTYGISLILAAFNLFYRDVQYVISLVILVWMYLTPIIYPVELLPPQYRFLFRFNPMAVIINAYRQTILGNSAPNFSSLALATVLSVIIIIIGYALFKKLEGIFADIV